MRNGLMSELMRAASRIAIVGVVGSLAAACSTDSARFAENPFSNPFGSSGSSEPAMTGSIDEPGPAPARSTPYPRETVRSEPVAPLRTAESPAPSHSPRVASTGTPGWSSGGGASITVGPGDTLTTISNRYGVPSTAILSANGMTASEVKPGRRIVIPVYSTNGGSGSTSRTAESSSSPHAGRVVSSSKIAPIKAEPPRSMAEAAEKKPRVRPGQPAAIAKVAPARATETVKTASRSTIDAKNPVKAPPKTAKVAAPVKVAAPAKMAAPEKPEPAAKPAKVVAAKTVEPAKTAPAKVAAIVPTKAAPAAEPVKVTAKEPEATGAIQAAPPAATGAEFRWPARGRVITGFGGGGSNEGINIAVPDGTPVKAAGDGVVAYAGLRGEGLRQPRPHPARQRLRLGLRP